jgi:hypothetical protein
MYSPPRRTPKGGLWQSTHRATFRSRKIPLGSSRNQASIKEVTKWRRNMRNGVFSALPEASVYLIVQNAFPCAVCHDYFLSESKTSPVIIKVTDNEGQYSLDHGLKANASVPQTSITFRVRASMWDCSLEQTVPRRPAFQRIPISRNLNNGAGRLYRIRVDFSRAGSGLPSRRLLAAVGLRIRA